MLIIAWRVVFRVVASVKIPSYDNDGRYQSISFQAIHSGEKKPPPSLLVTQMQTALDGFTPTEYFSSLF
jgi:hypothetical protein